MIDDFDRCYAAVRSRDARFDGWFTTAVTSTGIYCRPSCPALTPRRDNVRFYATAAAAQGAGFRACRRCRPDAAPGSPEWDLRADLVGRAMRHIADGVVDREGVAGLASRLGYSARHVHRQLRAEVGAGPVALARAQRAATARVLIETTALPLADVAFAAGFASVRQFNDTIRAVFSMTPTQLRVRARRGRRHGSDAVTLRLAFRRPGDPARTLAFLGARAIPAVEELAGDGTYRRSLALPHGAGTAELRATAPGHVAAHLRLDDLRDLTTAVGRCRRLLDLDADPEAVDAHLVRDALLDPLVRARPGLRVPGAVDGFELGVRALLGQQVSVAAARTLAGRLVARLGPPLPVTAGAVTHGFPSPQAIADGDLAGLGVTGARQRALRALAEAVATGTLDLGPGADRSDAGGRLLGVPGVGPWTAEYVAMRALGDPDAFPAGDLGLRRAAEQLGEDPTALPRRADAWRPWRAYAAAHLWASLQPAAGRAARAEALTRAP